MCGRDWSSDVCSSDLQLSEILTRMLQMPCDISKDLVGADIQIARIGEEKRDR